MKRSSTPGGGSSSSSSSSSSSGAAAHSSTSANKAKSGTDPELTTNQYMWIVLPAVMGLVNTLVGIWCQHYVNVPMYLVIRRTNTMFTLVMEFIMLRKLPTHNGVYLGVFLICVGAIIAGWRDIASATSQVSGYLLVLVHNCCTCTHTVSLNFVKRKLPDIDPFYFLLIIQLLTWPFLMGHASYEVLRANDMVPSSSEVTSYLHDVFVSPAFFDPFSLSLMSPVNFVAGIADSVTTKVLLAFTSASAYVEASDPVAYSQENWEVLVLIAVTVLSGGFNVIANPMCSIKHSALSQSVAGNTKDIIQTAIGGYFFSDYVFTYMNFSGIILSFMGCGTYVYVRYLEASGAPSVLDSLNTAGAKMKSVFGNMKSKVAGKMKKKTA